MAENPLKVIRSKAHVFMKAADILFDACHPMYFFAYSLYKRITERHDRIFIEQSVYPGAVVVDIGANIGFYTALLSRLVGDHGVVHAFEPSPVNFIHLRSHTAHLKNVILNNTAIGNKTERLPLYLSSDYNVDHRTYFSDPSRPSLMVDCTKLDDYFPQEVSISFIKMDIQGFEHQAFLGMQEIIERSPHIRILFEFWPSGLRAAGTEPDKLLEHLQASGLSLQFMHNRVLEPFHICLDSDEDSYFDVLASKKGDR